MAPREATPVHRLGRGTSGVLLCARSQAAREGLSRAFAEDAKGERRKPQQPLMRAGEDVECAKPIQKTYRALVYAPASCVVCLCVCVCVRVACRPKREKKKQAWVSGTPSNYI